MRDRRPHFVHVFATFAAAGPQIRTVRLIEALGGRLEHTIVPLDGRSEAMDLLAGRSDARCVAPPRRSRGPLAVWRMRELIARLAPDLLLTYNWGSFDAVLAARLLPGLPLVHHEEGFNADEAVRQKARRVWARRILLARAVKVVVPSQRLAAIAREAWRVDPERLEWIPNGIDVERFRPASGPASVREELGIPARALVVGSVGHLRAVKNFGRLIEACASVRTDALGDRPLHLLLVGDGPERAALEARALAHPPPGGRVHFAGHHSDLVPWYRAMDVFALSSDSEQHPVALIEAMASGLAVAATDVGDVRLVLPPEQAGSLVALGAGDAVALGGALALLLADADLRARLAAANRARVVERYSFGTMLERYGRLYGELLDPS